MVARDRRHRRQDVHRLRARDARHQLEREGGDAALREARGQLGLVERAQRADQRLPLAQAIRLVAAARERAGALHLRDQVGAREQRARVGLERGAGLGVGLVGEAGRLARARLHEQLDALRLERLHGVGHQRHAPLARRRLLGYAYDQGGLSSRGRQDKRGDAESHVFPVGPRRPVAMAARRLRDSPPDAHGRPHRETRAPGRGRPAASPGRRAGPRSGDRDERRRAPPGSRRRPRGRGARASRPPR